MAEYKKGAAAMITRMDKDVGKIIQLLKELDIQNETMIFFLFNQNKSVS